MDFIRDDGGRAAAGFKGRAGDCVVRAIAIATGKPYREVYDDLFALNRKRNRNPRKCSPRDGGTSKKTIRAYLESLGWTWTPTMQIGSGCKVHLADGELPSGRLIVAVSRHMTAVIDGVIHDAYDPQRTTIVCENGVQRVSKRCVYGYFSKA